MKIGLKWKEGGKRFKWKWVSHSFEDRSIATEMSLNFSFQFALFIFTNSNYLKMNDEKERRKTAKWIATITLRVVLSIKMISTKMAIFSTFVMYVEFIVTHIHTCLLFLINSISCIRISFEDLLFFFTSKLLINL